MSGYLRTGIRRNSKIWVTVLPSGKAVELASGASLLEAVLLTGHAVADKCAGHSLCGECHVWVLEGGRSLSKVRHDEQERLGRITGRETMSRLSCQAVLGSHEVTIELPTRPEDKTMASTETPKIESLIHVRFNPNGTVMEIGDRPQGVDAQAWFNYLSQNTANRYQALAGGRGLFRLPRPEVDDLKVAAAAGHTS